MLTRIIAIAALIVFLVLAVNGQIHRWLGLESFNGTNASTTGGGSDILAVNGWANAKLASKVCGFHLTDAVEALQQSDWDSDPEARKVMAMVRKQQKSMGDASFCEDVLKRYGPDGSEIAGLIEKVQ